MHKGLPDSKVKNEVLPVGTKIVLDEQGIAAMLSVLAAMGYRPVGPTVRDGAIVYDDIGSTQDLPVGLSDEQEGGRYRLIEGTPGAYFDYNVGPTSLKKYLFPARQKLWEADKKADGFDVKPVPDESPAYAFFGVRPCELAAVHIQDRVFGYGEKSHAGNDTYADSGYAARRSKSLIVVVNCGRAGKTCFCCSMGGGPQAQSGQGYDIVMTEIVDGKRHEFLVESGTDKGALILEKLPQRKATDADKREAETIMARTRRQMGRTMVADAAKVLKNNPEHGRWDDVAERCLACGNCTLVCPTCFCNTVEDTTSLVGDHAERWRLWDSCFSIDFSYIHGGSVRTAVSSRYRQWITHKLSYWHEQFDTSGCVGCGRCITWCPVGIDITEEAKAIKYNSR